jgi:hypothetical protein
MLLNTSSSSSSVDYNSDYENNDSNYQYQDPLVLSRRVSNSAPGPGAYDLERATNMVLLVVL